MRPHAWVFVSLLVPPLSVLCLRPKLTYRLLCLKFKSAHNIANVQEEGKERKKDVHCVGVRIHTFSTADS